jgi:predicted AlkP superfamily phosphohydrolase/phosphomutase
VNLNTWLVQEGFMVLKRPESDAKNLDDLFVAGTFWEHVDWTRTRAYAMGLGQIYFNLRGREGQGVVSPGSEAVALADSITGRLLALIDPDTGETIVRGVYKRDDIYRGEYLENASDLQVGFKDGYRVSWQTALGGAPAGIIYPNMKKWSGDHGSFDFSDTAGTLICTRKLPKSRYSIMDVAPSVLRHFGITPPADVDGTSFLD